MTTPILRSLLVAACAALFAPALSAAPGDLDTTFGTSGKVDTGINPAFGSGRGPNLVVQGDGKIVAAGYSLGSNSDFALVRFNADGTFDNMFGTGGMVTTDFNGNFDEASSVAVQSDGKIVVAGKANNGSDIDFALARYNANGTLDSGFGSGGKVITPFINGSGAKSVAVQGDGKIVAVGFTNFTSPPAVVMRYNSDGTIDSAFGTGGKVTAFPSRSDSLGSVALQSDGKIVVAGTSTPGYDFSVARYNADGTLDTGFGSGGGVTTDFAGGDDLGQSMAVQSDGKIVVAGGSDDGLGNFNTDFALARYNSDGTLDSTFGTGGKVRTDFGTNAEYAYGVAVQSDGKIVATGIANNNDFALARYNADGTLDSAFGTGGKVRSSFGTTGVYGLSVAVQADGNVVAGAYIDGYAVVRFLGGSGAVVNPPLDPPVYDTTGMTTDGSAFLAFGAPAVDGGVVGGAATVKANGKKQTIIYGDANGDVLVRTGGQDVEGATFTALGDPIFAGEALGFAATAELAPSSIPALRRVGFGVDERVFAVRPGGRLAALYSQLSRAGGIHRLAGQADPAPGGGQFARFPSFALPRQRVGLLYAALLHRGGTVNARNDSGIWRERSDGTGTDLLLRTGTRFSRTRGGGSDRGLKKVTFMPPVSNATDQRLSHAPDGGLGALGKFDDGSEGVVRVVADGTVDVPLDDASAVPDEAGTADGSVEFVRFAPPATASGGRLALVAALRAAARGQAAPPQAVFANTGGSMQRVLARGEAVPGLTDARWGQLGQPLLGEKGMIGLIAALTGRGVSRATNKALVRIENGTRTVAARLGDAAPGYGSGVVFRKFMSMVVTDSDPGRIVFTALVGGPGVNGSNNVGLWSIGTATGTNLVLRSGGTIQASGNTLTVRTFETLIAPKKSRGQGRSTDASGFITAKAKLSDGRVGVLRIPLP